MEVIIFILKEQMDILGEVTFMQELGLHLPKAREVLS